MKTKKDVGLSFLPKTKMKTLKKQIEVLTSRYNNYADVYIFNDFPKLNIKETFESELK